MVVLLQQDRMRPMVFVKVLSKDSRQAKVSKLKLLNFFPYCYTSSLVLGVGTRENKRCKNMLCLTQHLLNLSLSFSHKKFRFSTHKDSGLRFELLTVE